ncbi:hypothetical protein L2E82_18474 [Cichorium intybus]|uniref:Uncharacterized protein n=1 Tax=Cichorium intybus TaxID=13427 RepID=A0ACB9FAX3_CICIN|nr:hypothetical protein L2E82_18474 [Cichorium intybus]
MKESVFFQTHNKKLPNWGLMLKETYKYENNRVLDASPDVSSPLQSQLYGNGNIASKGTQNQLLERQKAHVQQFVATEDQLNKAAEAFAFDS